jgi:hypothetical protein
MSGTAALASARRRRAIPQKPEQNEVIEPPKQLSQQQQQPLAANPMMLLLKHNQQLAAMQAEIDQLKNTAQLLNIPKIKDDKESLEYYKSQHLILLEEMREVKKTLLKVQTFSMETNLELMKLKKTSTRPDTVLEVNEIIES